MPRVMHFDFSADNPERAIEFYKGVFGWEFSKWNGPADYWLVTTGPEHQPGIDGGMSRRTEQSVAANTIDVPSVDDFVQKIVGAGGKVMAPKMAIPGVGYMAYCSDTEGNTFGIMEEDPSAQDAG